MDTKKIYNLELLVKPAATATRDVMNCLAKNRALIESLLDYSSNDDAFWLEII